MLVASSDPFEQKVATVDIYQLERSSQCVHLELEHRIQANAQKAGFSQVKGIELILYPENPLAVRPEPRLTVVDLAETFTNPDNEPATRHIPIGIACHHYLDLGCSFGLVEGVLDGVALVDIEANRVAAYFRQTDMRVYYVYEKGAYTELQSVLFVLHNSASGAEVNSFAVYFQTRRRSPRGCSHCGSVHPRADWTWQTTRKRVL